MNTENNATVDEEVPAWIAELLGTEWSYEHFPRVIVQEIRKRGRGWQVVHAAYSGTECEGIYKVRLKDFLKAAKPL